MRYSLYWTQSTFTKAGPSVVLLIDHAHTFDEMSTAITHMASCVRRWVPSTTPDCLMSFPLPKSTVVLESVKAYKVKQ